jgi:predicted heme/steroid binding protein
MDDTRRFTAQELARYDGRHDVPAYVACAGVVYDVSESFLWRRGRHQAEHQAGADLTAALAGAPHGDDLLSACPVVGRLVAEGASEPPDA